MADSSAPNISATPNSGNASNYDRGSARKFRGRGGARGRGGQQRGRGGGGSRGGRGSDRSKEIGRRDYNRNQQEKKRTRNDEWQTPKRQKLDGDANKDSPFSQEEINGEERRPKRKVAVMIGYAGSGYKGMQINLKEKTIEGDLFKAFIAAGAISKANADDPKKSSLVRCARTDKGVHAAGNVISLKLIVEDPNIVQMVNDHLPPQIRMWGFERTNGSFSCYQTCDSRWYEYLIPTYSFLPPHPQSFLGKELVQSAKQVGNYESYKSRQEDVANFWDDVQKNYIDPVLDRLSTETRAAVMAEILKNDEAVVETPAGASSKQSEKKHEIAEPVTEDVLVDESFDLKKVEDSAAKEDGSSISYSDVADGLQAGVSAPAARVLTPVEAGIKDVKAAIIAAKKAYRISSGRQKAVQDALSCYLGTRNFHNYTIQKAYSDPSAKRVIRSFKVHPDPIIINDTEWLSLKVHGQSFMMHQIRKMVAMAALVVRCGSTTDIMFESFGPANISIPKAPSLGLLLERPVFESYNQRAQRDYEREKIDFDKYEKEMNEFKQREIYDRIFREEEKDHQFHTFFNHIDHFKSEYFLWITASGVAAAKQSKDAAKMEDDSDEEADGAEEG